MQQLFSSTLKWEELPAFLRGDQIRLQQVLVNLIKNALKFCRGKPIRVLTAYNRETEKLHVQVADEGKGLKAEEISKLFTLFGRIERTQSDNIEGVGLGLVICKKIVENNEGRIDVFSAGEGQGATFQFSMHMTEPKL